MRGILDKRKREIILSLLVFLVILHFCGGTLAQEESKSSPCPKPYIKLIKPNVAKAGEQVIIRGQRFGKDSGEVIFSPGLNGKVINWTHSRITAEVPSGAKAGDVIVKTGCASSNGEFFKVAE